MFNYHIDRAKAIVKRHQSEIIFGAGVVTGVTGMIWIRRAIPVHVVAPISSEELQYLIDHTEDSMSYLSPRPRAVIELFNSVNLKNK